MFFISIHANAVDGNTSACGTETHILGEDERSKATNYNAIKRCSDEEAGELIDMSDETVAALERAIIESRQMVNGAYNRALANIIERNYAEAGMKSRGSATEPVGGASQHNDAWRPDRNRIYEQRPRPCVHNFR